MIPTTARTLHASAAETASGNGPTIDLGGQIAPQLPDDTLRLTLDVSAINASAFAVYVDTSDDQATWSEIGTLTVSAVTGSIYKVVQPASRYVRARWVITGSTVTFSIAGVSLLPYANVSRLRNLGKMADAYSDITDEQLDGELSKACGRADNILADARYELPLLLWDDSLADDVISIAVWNIVTQLVGYNPENGRDDVFKIRSDSAFANLRRGSYAGIVDSTVNDNEGRAFIESDMQRRWGPQI